MAVGVGVGGEEAVRRSRGDDVAPHRAALDASRPPLGIDGHLTQAVRADKHRAVGRHRHTVTRVPTAPAVLNVPDTQSAYPPPPEVSPARRQVGGNQTGEKAGGSMTWRSWWPSARTSQTPRNGDSPSGENPKTSHSPSGDHLPPPARPTAT